MPTDTYQISSIKISSALHALSQRWYLLVSERVVPVAVCSTLYNSNTLKPPIRAAFHRSYTIISTGDDSMEKEALNQKAIRYTGTMKLFTDHDERVELFVRISRRRAALDIITPDWRSALGP